MAATPAMQLVLGAAQNNLPFSAVSKNGCGIAVEPAASSAAIAS